MTTRSFCPTFSDLVNKLAVLHEQGLSHLREMGKQHSKRVQSIDRHCDGKEADRCG